MKLAKLYSTLLFTAFVAGSLASCVDNASTDSKSKTATDSSVGIDLSSIEYNGKIAFIRMDSLMSGYGLCIDLTDEFAKKQQKAQTELASRGRNLEREAMEFQEKAQKGLITRYQAQTTEEGLQKKQQSIIAYRDKVLAELAQEEVVVSNEISQTVLEFLREYNAEKKYSMIMQTTAGNPIILADPALDITAEVLRELNIRYEKSIDSKQAKK